MISTTRLIVTGVFVHRLTRFSLTEQQCVYVKQKGFNKYVPASKTRYSKILGLSAELTLLSEQTIEPSKSLVIFTFEIKIIRPIFRSSYY